MNNAKDFLNKIYDLLDSVENAATLPDGMELSLRQCCTIELQRYFMYLSASDGSVSPSERDFMNELFDINFSIQDYVNFINETDTYSVEFEQTVPLIIQLVKNFDSKADTNIAGLILDYMDGLGNVFLQCDGNVAPQELTDKATYISNIRNYIGNNEIIKKKEVNFGNSLKDNYLKKKK